MDDLKYFVNLEELDLSENHINIMDLMNLPVLKSLKIRSSMLEQIAMGNSPQFFANLQNLDLAFNKLNFQQIKNVFHLPILK